MKTYTKPEIEVKQFANGDIITLSNETNKAQSIESTKAIQWSTL